MKRENLAVLGLGFVAAMVIGLMVALSGCVAGTRVTSKSYSQAVNEATGKVYIDHFDITRGSTAAVNSKLDSGSLRAYAEGQADGSYIVDLDGQAQGADAVAGLDKLVELAQEFSKMLPEGQLVGFVAAIKGGDVDIQSLIDEYLTSRPALPALEPLVAP